VLNQAARKRLPAAEGINPPGASVDASDIAVVAGATSAGLAIFTALSWRDARRWRVHDRAERAAERQARSRESARVAEGVRYAYALNTALGLLDRAERAVFHLWDRTELYSSTRMAELGLKNLADDIAIQSSSLPQPAREAMCKCHHGVAAGIEVLLANPYPDDAPCEGIKDRQDHHIQLGKLAIAQFESAQELRATISTAREAIRDHLSIH
jgi:hypothetical protein